MELEQLRHLDAIARYGGISAAAPMIHVSQSTLSRSVRKLEAELGQELFDRTRNRAELNDAGRLAVEHARAVLREERAMLDAFGDLSRKRRTLRIATMAPAPLWHITSDIVANFQGVILEPEIVADETEVERRLYNRACDIAITTRPLILPTTRSTPIMVENLFAFVPNDHRLATRDTVSFDDLDGETFLIDQTAGFWIDMHRRACPHSTVITQPDRRVLIELLRTSGAIGFVTDVSSSTQDVASGRVRIPIVDASAHVTFYLSSLVESTERVQDIMDWFAQGEV